MVLIRDTAKFYWGFISIMVLGIVYHLSGPTTLTDADSGEFALLAVYGGVAHPPGYPLYLLILKLVAKLSPPFPYIELLSFTSIIFALIGAYLIFITLAAIFKSMTAALVGMFATFFASGVWRIATTIEPFALNYALIGLGLFSSWQICKQGESATEKKYLWIFIAGVAMGLGLCNHHSLVFMLPLVIGAGVFYLWQTRQNYGRVIVMFAVGSITGALPLLFLFFSKPHPDMPLSWTVIDSLQSLSWHVLRKDYGTFNLDMEGKASGLAMLRYFFENLPHYYSWVFLIPLLIGIWRIVTGSKVSSQDSRVETVYLRLVFAAFLAAAVGFFLMFNIKIGLVSSLIVERFVHLPLILASVIIAGGWKDIERVLLTKIKEPLVLIGSAIVVISLHGALQWRTSERRSHVFTEVDVYNTLKSVEDHAAIITHSDAEVLNLLYGKYILGLRPDVDIIHPGIWGSDFYRHRTVEKLGLAAEYQKEEWHKVLEKLITLRPVYTTSIMQKEEKPFLQHSYPYGRLTRFVAPDQRLPMTETIIQANTHLFAYVYNLPLEPEKLDPWETLLLSKYRRAYRIFKDENVKLAEKIMIESENNKRQH